MDAMVLRSLGNDIDGVVDSVVVGIAIIITYKIDTLGLLLQTMF